MAEWRKCTSCKTSISFQAPYWICNVSTCQKKRAGLVFCSPSCWDAHVPVLRHKESWAEERRSPSETDWQKMLSGEKEDTTYPARPKAAVEAAPEPKRVSAAPAPILRRRRE